MTLHEVFEQESTVTRNEALRTILQHGCDFAEFESEHGAHSEYNGRIVLEWLGY